MRMTRGLIRTNCSWPLIMFILFFLSSCNCKLSDARQHHKNHIPSAVVVGTVYCDTCFQDDVSKATHYISGATVGVECKEESSRPGFYKEVETDKQGRFKVALPFSVSKHVREIKGCNVKLVKSSEPYCAVASTSSSSSSSTGSSSPIHLKERKRGKHIFSAGFFTFKPFKQPGLCNQHPSLEQKQQLLQPQQFFPFPPIISPPPTFLPPNPLQPAPLVPNPFQPPAAPLIPNPFQPPTPPPSLLPPLPPFPQMPPLPNLPLPSVPGLSPPVLPPPPPPSFGIPSLPFPPLIPRIPFPPASNNPKKEAP